MAEVQRVSRCIFNGSTGESPSVGSKLKQRVMDFVGFTVAENWLLSPASCETADSPSSGFWGTMQCGLGPTG